MASSSSAASRAGACAASSAATCESARSGGTAVYSRSIPLGTSARSAAGTIAPTLPSHSSRFTAPLATTSITARSDSITPRSSPPTGTENSRATSAFGALSLPLHLTTRARSTPRSASVPGCSARSITQTVPQRPAISAGTSAALETNSTSTLLPSALASLPASFASITGEPSVRRSPGSTPSCTATTSGSSLLSVRVAISPPPIRRRSCAPRRAPRSSRCSCCARSAPAAPR